MSKSLENKYAVEVKGIKKSFYLPHHKNDSLKAAITQSFKKKEKGNTTFNALDGISFNIKKGDFFGILGRNGSGKSTLLKIISEIYQPTSGSVKYDGKLVSFIELGVGFKAELTGRENVYLNGALLGFSKQEVEAMYDEIVGFAELERFMDQKLKNYSSGMRVRLAFSVAIRAKADILVLDEVLAVGDAAFREKCNNYFESLKDEGKTVILVTHGMGNVRKYCNRAIVIDGGKIIYNGSGEGAADEYTELFAKDKSGAGKGDHHRWGDEGILVEDTQIKVDDDIIKVRLSLKSNDAEVDDARVGLRIIDENDKAVAAVNNNESDGLISFSPGQTRFVTYEFPNVFTKKDYTINITVSSGNGKIVHDAWVGASKFSVKGKNARAHIQLPVKLKIED